MKKTSRPLMARGRNQVKTKARKPRNIHEVSGWARDMRPKSRAAPARDKRVRPVSLSSRAIMAQRVNHRAALKRKSRSICGRPEMENRQSRSVSKTSPVVNQAMRGSKRPRTRKKVITTEPRKSMMPAAAITVSPM